MHDSLGQQRQQQNHSHNIVQDYLDSLLREVSLSVLREDSEPLPTDNCETQALSAVPVQVEPEPAVTQDIEKTRVVHQTPKPTRTTVSERSVPDWGRKGFSALLFEVGGIKMAAPLHTLGGICLIEDNLQTVAAQANWFMGLLRWNDRNLRVVDTAMFIMPERLKDDSHRGAYQSVIILGDSHWALAVDQADESTMLQADEVRWKHLLGTRPWLAGTLLNRLCALVDVDGLQTLLSEADTGLAIPNRQS